MKMLIIAISLALTGCAGYGNWSPIQTVQGSDGSKYYWIAPLPATADGSPGVGGRSASVTTYQGTVNGRGYTITSFK